MAGLNRRFDKRLVDLSKSTTDLEKKVAALYQEPYNRLDKEKLSHEMTATEKMREWINELLASEPEASTQVIDIWSNLRTLNCKFFDDVWAKITEEEPNIAYDKCRISSGRLKDGGSWRGLESVDTGKSYAIQRHISVDSYIIVRSYRNDENHGLYVEANGTNFKVYVAKNGKPIFRMYFDASGKIIERKDP